MESQHIRERHFREKNLEARGVVNWGLYVAQLLILVALVAGVVIIAAPNSGHASEPSKSAQQYMDKVNTQTMAILAAGRVSQAQKEMELRVLLDQNLNVALIGRFAVGSAWKTASEAQRAAYQSAFRDWVLRTYAKRLASYGGNGMSVQGVKPVGKKDQLVLTRIKRDSGKPIEAGWRVRAYGEKHKVLDVVISGVSLVVTQRAEFRSVLKRHGMDGLITMLEKKAAALSFREKQELAAVQQ